MTHISNDFLTDNRVKNIYSRCYRDENLKRDTTQVEAWILRHTFSMTELYKERENIVKCLLCVPDGFRVDEKGGGSVAALTMRADNTKWTDDMATIEKLVSLGIAVGLVSFLVPRDKWSKLPGGLPYVRIDITKFGVTVN